MRPIRLLGPEVARRLEGVVFDLDGTVLTGGKLGLDAYRALYELRSSGLRLLACTGRPAGWGELIARQWPVDAVVTENGAIGHTLESGRLVRVDRLDDVARRARRARLFDLATLLRADFPDVPLTDDLDARVSDVAFDIGEVAPVAPERRIELHAAAREHGAHTYESSIHLHVTLDTDDKASGVVRLLSRLYGVDPTRALSRYLFVGDSSNDEPCFSAFRCTAGVENVRRFLPRLTVAPGWVAEASEGEGFAEIASHLARARGGA